MAIITLNIKNKEIEKKFTISELEKLVNEYINSLDTNIDGKIYFQSFDNMDKDMVKEAKNFRKMLEKGKVNLYNI